MKKIGVAGGVASGKSLVAKQFQELGAVVLDADRVGHEVLRDPQVKTLIRDRWGSEVFDTDGEVNRKSLAAIVFANTDRGRAELAELEKITHPGIRKSLQLKIERLIQQKKCSAVILDAPVMFKSGWNHFCDVIVFVENPLAVRLKRVSARGWD